jgi:hypothetical protein
MIGCEFIGCDFVLLIKLYAHFKATPARSMYMYSALFVAHVVVVRSGAHVFPAVAIVDAKWVAIV